MTGVTDVARGLDFWNRGGGSLVAGLMTAATNQPTPETERLLAYLPVAHYVMGGLTAFCGFFPFIHLAVGIGMISGEMDQAPEPMGWLFVGIASVAIAFFWVLAGLTIYAGRCVARRRKRVFCLVVAIAACVFFQPIGLLLGIFSLVMLLKPEVRASFDRAEPV